MEKADGLNQVDLVRAPELGSPTQSGNWVAVLEGGKHRADWAEGGVDAQLLGLLEQSVAAFHQAGGPPGAVGVESPQTRKRVSHHRDCAEVLHGRSEARR